MSSPLLPHHDRPPCRSCHALTTAPDEKESSLVRCLNCGATWAGSDVELAQARRAEEAWSLLAPEAQRVATRIKPVPSRRIFQ